MYLHKELRVLFKWLRVVESLSPYPAAPWHCPAVWGFTYIPSRPATWKPAQVLVLCLPHPAVLNCFIKSYVLIGFPSEQVKEKTNKPNHNNVSKMSRDFSETTAFLRSHIGCTVGRSEETNSPVYFLVWLSQSVSEEAQAEKLVCPKVRVR